MSNKVVVSFILFTVYYTGVAQQTQISGTVLEPQTATPIPDVRVRIKNSILKTMTDNKGAFVFNIDIPLGEQIIELSKIGYETKLFPITVNAGKQLNISGMTLDREDPNIEEVPTIMLTDDELDNDIGGADNISGLLQASRDVFQRTAAFDFSASFFKLRGLDSNKGVITINGITMNKLYNGRPQWSNWGGLNDVTRNQELTPGLMPSQHNFGGLLNTTNISTRASEYRRGGRTTYTSANRSYNNRLLVSYASGVQKKGWAFAFAASKLWGNEGFQDATLYDAYAFFSSIEKTLNNNHSLNLTLVYAPNRRGKSSPNTQEVYNIKGITYNAYWGWQDNHKRNSRIKEVEEPFGILSHYWNINAKTLLQTNVSYQFGTVGNSRLDYGGTDLINGIPEGGGANPSPTYYQKLPSYFLRESPNDLGTVYGAQQAFLNNGQLDWTQLYSANVNRSQAGGNAIYALYEDKVEDNQLTVNSILNMDLKENIQLTTVLNYTALQSKNYASIKDLLGANTFLDVDSFATDSDEAQSDLLNPNRLVREGDKFRYHYTLSSTVLDAYSKVDVAFKSLDFYVSANVMSTQYQREGHYKNGANPENSLGKGEKQQFMGIGVKLGAMYKISGKHFVEMNGAYITKAPTLQNTYTNARVNHHIVPQIDEEQWLSSDLSYSYRSSFINSKITAYYTSIQNANEISFYYADGITGFEESREFISQILQGINKTHTGIEFGIETQVLPSLKLKGVASVGEFVYSNNPNLYVSSNQSTVSFGTTTLKNYKLAVGPHRAFSLGFEYRDPKYWWFGATANLFSHTFVAINPLIRSSNFYTDPLDGQVFNNYNNTLARKLLKQEQFKDYFVVNLVGGKSWKIKDYYLGLFVSVNNLLDKQYKTGGFEQGRNANYRQLKEDKVLSIPVFGTKYWYGRGATYFANVYIRF